MGRYLRPFLSRILQFAISLLALLLMTFGLLFFFPGSPLNEEKNLDPQILHSLQEFYGLNQGFWRQFWIYLEHLIAGDLGFSMHFVGRRVGSLIWEFGQTSVLLGGSAFALALIGSFLYLLATRIPKIRKGRADFFLMLLSSIPTLALGPFCIWLLSFHWSLLPVALLESPRSYILPIFLLALKPTLSLTRVLTNQVDQILTENYIQTARAFGHSEVRILCRWALRNSLTSYLSQAGPLFAGLISGSFLVEVLFAIPGLGYQFVDSVLNRDWPLILGFTLVYGVTLMLAQMFTDFLLVLTDPRMEAL